MELIGTILAIFLIYLFIKGWPWSAVSLAFIWAGYLFSESGKTALKRAVSDKEKFKAYCWTGFGDLCVNMGTGFFLVVLIQWLLPLAVGDPDPQWVLHWERVFVEAAERAKQWLNPATGNFFVATLLVAAATILVPSLQLLKNYNKAVSWAGRLSTILSTLLLFTFMTTQKSEGQWMAHFRDKFDAPLSEIQRDRDMATTALYQYAAVSDMLSGPNLDKGVTALDTVGQNPDQREKYFELGQNYWNADYYQYALANAGSVTGTSAEVETSFETAQAWLKGGGSAPSFGDLDRLNAEADRIHQKAGDVQAATGNLIQNAITQYALKGLSDQQQDLVTVLTGAFIAVWIEKAPELVDKIKGYFGQGGRLPLDETAYWTDKHPLPSGGDGSSTGVQTIKAGTPHWNTDWRPFEPNLPVRVEPWRPPFEPPVTRFVP